MKISCVIISVNYGDFLAHTLPSNKHQFNDLVVVTSSVDKITQQICEYYHVRCIKTDDFYADGNIFNKGKGINVGISSLISPEWICHMDADILLPPLTRKYLELVDLNPLNIYSLDRMMCQSYSDFLSFLHFPPLQHEQDVFVHIRPFPLGVRIAKREYGGYIPIGFFQLWHASRGFNTYPEEHSTAARSDMLHAIRWPRKHRILLPELIALHLSTEINDAGKNWNGRVTKEFFSDSIQSTIDQPHCYDYNETT